jgi:hypothetical protein
MTTDCIPPRVFYFLGRVKNVSKQSDRRRSGAISADALIGLGITVAALGLLCLMLGWAEHMRAISKFTSVWFGCGAGLVIAGLLLTALARSRGRR